MLARLLIAIIRVYQWTIAPLFGNVCRFEPSCSRYTIECIRLHGAFKGAWLGMRRILRCHPFNPGGYDPPPTCLHRRVQSASPNLLPSPAEQHQATADEHRLTDCSEVC